MGTYPGTELRLKVLSDKEVAILRRLGAFMIPEGGPLPGSGADDETITAIDALLAGSPLHKRRLLQALPLLFEHGTLLDRYGARRLIGLPERLSDPYLLEWAKSTDPLRAQLWVALKTLFGLTYFEREDVAIAMGAPTVCGIRP